LLSAAPGLEVEVVASVAVRRELEGMGEAESGRKDSEVQYWKQKTFARLD
jgi:hypothetical protein